MKKKTHTKFVPSQEKVLGHAFGDPFSCLGRLASQQHSSITSKDKCIASAWKKKQRKRKSNQKRVSLYGFFAPFKCNLVLFADIGYWLYVHPSITWFGRMEQTKKKMRNDFLSTGTLFIYFLFSFHLVRCSIFLWKMRYSFLSYILTACDDDFFFSKWFLKIDGHFFCHLIFKRNMVLVLVLIALIEGYQLTTPKTVSWRK